MKKRSRKRRESGDNPHERVRSLRTKLDLTQDQVAERSGGQITRLIVLAVEKRRNKLTSRSTFKAMAAGLGLTEAELDDLLANRVGVEDLAARVLAREPNLAAS